MIYYGNELYHYGIKGQKWGDRNYQYEDGSLTPAGKRRYGVGTNNRSDNNKSQKTYGYYSGKRKNIKLADRSVGKTVVGGIARTFAQNVGIGAVSTFASLKAKENGHEAVSRAISMIGTAAAIGNTIRGVTDTVSKAKKISIAKDKISSKMNKKVKDL